MSLRDDIGGAILDAKPGDPLDVDLLVDAVWAVLEDKVGSVQEALMEQLTAVRTELSAARRREEAYRVSIRSLTQQLAVALAENGIIAPDPDVP